MTNTLKGLLHHHFKKQASSDMDWDWSGSLRRKLWLLRLHHTAKNGPQQALH